MGCGKSTVGKLVARALVWNYIDLDALVARHTGRSVREIFAEESEDAFRRYESHALKQALQKPRTVVALGGGTPTQPDNRMVASGRAFSVWLRVGFEACVDRTAAATSRPLLDDLEAARQLFRERTAHYAHADATVDGEQAPEAVAAALVAQVRGEAS